jgi:hypothetical protein
MTPSESLGVKKQFRAFITTLRGGGVPAKAWPRAASVRGRLLSGRAVVAPRLLATIRVGRIELCRMRLPGGTALGDGVGTGYSGRGRRVGQKDLN